jgi:hypothetical protein
MTYYVKQNYSNTLSPLLAYGKRSRVATASREALKGQMMDVQLKAVVDSRRLPSGPDTVAESANSMAYMPVKPCRVGETSRQGRASFGRNDRGLRR